MTLTRGFIVPVRHYGHDRPSGPTDCSNLGATSFKRGVRFAIIEHPAGEAYEAGPDVPALSIVRSASGRGTYFHLEPVEPVSPHAEPIGDLCGPMAGGNWIEPTDRVLIKALGGQEKVKIHDRYDTWDTYYAMTRD